MEESSSTTVFPRTFEEEFFAVGASVDCSNVEYTRQSVCAIGLEPQGPADATHELERETRVALVSR